MTAQQSYLADAGISVSSEPRPTDFEARSGGEGEVGALGIGTYWFARSVDEMTLHPRPASPGKPTNVETDHPHGVLTLTLFSCVTRLHANTHQPRPHSRMEVYAPQVLRRVYLDPKTLPCRRPAIRAARLTNWASH